MKINTGLFFKGQFVFLHKALLEFIRCGITEFAANELRDRIQMLKELKSNGNIRLTEEFQVYMNSPIDL